MFAANLLFVKQKERLVVVTTSKTTIVTGLGPTAYPYCISYYKPVQYSQHLDLTSKFQFSEKSNASVSVVCIKLVDLLFFNS